jgi:4-hydroxybenzoate polyprenyltransferase
MAAVTGGLDVARTRVSETARLVMLQHTVFALPFAVISMITATPGGWPAPRVWWWVAVAMVGARTAAMAFNRLADHRLDAANPRTAARPLPSGTLSRTWAWCVVGVSAVAFVVAAGMLNRTCLLLAPPTLAVLLGYSYAKRFTSLSHVWLGAALGLAPIGAWLAVTGSLSWPPVILGAAVTCWVAGFDVVYSLQDEAFDRAHGLRSIPSRMGVGPALVIARALHVAALIGFGAFAVAAGGGAIRLAAVAASAVLLVWQHRLVRHGHLDRIDAAFFTANGTLSLLMGVAFLFAKMRGIG